MSFSTAELFQSSANGSMTHNNGKSKIRTGNSMKITKNKKNNNYNHHNNYNNNRIFHEKQDSSNFIHHVPHNSTSEHYRFFEDIGAGNGSNIFQHEHVPKNNNFAHIHNNSLASISNQNNNLYHNRNDTISKYVLDDSLEVIDGDIPSQKDIMKDFFEERVHKHLQQKSSLYDALDTINKNTNEDHTNMHHKINAHSNPNANIMNDSNFSGTVREILSSPLDESDIINFNDLPLQERYNEIDIPDYTDDEAEDNQIDPMQLIAAKNSLKSSFPDTQAITRSLMKKKSYRRRRHNTKKSPIPQVGDMTPSSVVIRSDDSDNDTYNSSNDSEPHPISHRGSQRIKTPSTLASTANTTPFPPPQQQRQGQQRSNTIGNMSKMIKKSNSNSNKHRHSRSELPKSIKKNDLFNIYKRKPFAGGSAKKYFSNLTQAAKSSQYEAEKKARQEMEKKYKPQLQKTQLELDEARRKSLVQQQEMNNMKKQLLLLKSSGGAMASKVSTNEKEINKKLREKNLRIQELQSKLKFETLKNNSIISPISPIIPVAVHSKINKVNKYVPIPIPLAISAPHGVNEGLHRLKKRVSIKRSHHKKALHDLKKRKSLPDSLSKKHKRPLWTNRCKNNNAVNVTSSALKSGVSMNMMTKSKTFDSDEASEEDKYQRLGIKHRVIKKRESLLLFPPKNLKNRFFDRNKIKRNSWNAGDDKQDKVDYDKLNRILVAAQQNHKNKNMNNMNENDLMLSKYKDIQSKYDHLLAENEILRKDNFEKKDELKKYELKKAPIPIPVAAAPQQKQVTLSHDLPPPTFKIERQKKMKKKDIVKKKRLLQIPRTKMMKMEWIAIENKMIKDTRWKYIGSQSDDIVIPNEFEELFCVQKEKEEKEYIGSSREEIVGFKLREMKLTPQDIRFALLNVAESKLSEKILYNLLEIVPNLNEQKAVQNKMNRIQENAFSESTYLSFVEQFFYELSDINHLKLRVELILFKHRFQNIINERYNELYMLLESLKSIQRSSNFERMLSIILTFGNFMNADSSGCGINGFKLESLLNLSAMKCQSNAAYTFLSYVCKYCIENNKKKYLNIVCELDLCIRASSIKSYECHQKILLITEELSKFGRSLRKFRKKAIANNSTDGATYKAIENDLFETAMRDFARRAHLICKSLLDLRHEIITIAQILSAQYNYDLNVDKIEDLLGIFAKFIGDLKYAKNLYINHCHRDKSNIRRKFAMDKKKEKLSSFLIKKNEMIKNEKKPIYVYDQDTIESKEREKDENIQKISKLIYEHAILMDQQHINYYDNEIMSYQRIKYLKGLAKSNELPNQLSNNPEAIQKERRRRRSLTNTDIQIGNKMAMTLAEDEEMK